ncbi:MAG: ECF-type sigma factor [Pirellulales bacterium]
MTEVTRILNAVDQGDPGSADDLLPLIYAELRRLAAERLAHEKPGQTLQATALVHETYIRLVGSADRNWDSRGHFFVAAAEAMRRILIDHARRKGRLKRGGDRRRVELRADDCICQSPCQDVLALDAALAKLEQRDDRKAMLVKLRFFSGLTVEQAADALGISRTTANQWWAYSRAWLYREIESDS